MKNKTILLPFFILIIGCNQQNDESKNRNESIKNEIRKDFSKDKTGKTGNNFQHTLYPKNDAITFRLNMDSADRYLIIPVKISSGKELFARLSSKDKKANIRISQIEFPDSTFDGPFGRNLNYIIKLPGNYKIIIGQNIMAGDPWNGNFVLKIWVE
jgi:hypothetical protein